MKLVITRHAAPVGLVLRHIEAGLVGAPRRLHEARDGSRAQQQRRRRHAGPTQLAARTRLASQTNFNFFVIFFFCYTARLTVVARFFLYESRLRECKKFCDFSMGERLLARCFFSAGHKFAVW